MPSTLTRRLVRLPLRLLAALLATVAAVAAVWYGGLSVLNWIGVANPARGDTGTALGLGAATIGTSVVPTWMTARYYFESKDRLSRSSERATASEADAGDTVEDTAADIPSDGGHDAGSEDAQTVEVVDAIETDTGGRRNPTVEEELVTAAESLPLVSELSDATETRDRDLQEAVRLMFGRRNR